MRLAHCRECLRLTFVARALTLFMIPVFLYVQHITLCGLGILPSDSPNPFAPFILPQGKQPNGKYIKTKWDFLFVATYVVFWSL